MPPKRGSAQPLPVYVQRAKEAKVLREVFGKPQRLTVVGDRLYWLEGVSQELYSVALSGSGTNEVTKVIAAVQRKGKMTKEEELLRERQRTTVTGISSFRVRESDGAVFFISGVNFSVYYPRTEQLFDVFSEVRDESVKALFSGTPNMNVQHVDGKPLEHFTFVNSGNIFAGKVVESADADGSVAIETVVERVTTIGTPLQECGTADYIIQEEFSRYTGHWARGERILFTVTDTSKLKEVTLTSASGELERMPFPKVGDANAVTSVAVYEVASKQFRLLPLASLKAVAPWVEYIPRLGFVNDDVVYCVLLSRSQEQSLLVTVQVKDLPVVPQVELLVSSSANTTAPAAVHEAISRLDSQNIPWAWVEVTNGMSLSDEAKIVVKHAVESDTAHFHLYHLDESETTTTTTAGAAATWRPLTSGTWNVRPTISVHHAAGGRTVVLFEANKNAQLGNELFTLEITSGGTGSTEPRRLSPAGVHVHSYAPVFDAAGAITSVAMVTSTMRTPPTLAVFNADGGAERKLRTFSFSTPQQFVVPEVHAFPNTRGSNVHAAVYLPTNRDPTTTAPLPLMIYVYGGPHVQLVNANNFEMCCMPLMQLLAQQGVAVAVVDNQMSNVNGLRDLAICKKNMGRFETEDNVTLAKAILGKYAGVIDPSRVGIFGWSYGGYATLLAMAQAPDVFAIGLAGAPVGDWRLYDTGYTERYMGLLPESDEAYKKGTVAHVAAGFPDDLNRVFIAQGLLDENVHFSHTCSVIDAMVAQCKPYVLHLYPGERHGLRQNPLSRSHYDALFLKTVHELL